MRGARSVGRATGIDRTVQLAAEEAIVGAIESEAVERALARLLRGPMVEEAVQDALESDAVKRAILEAMDSELVDEVWRWLLSSEEAQQLVERIAGAPELRAAISAQGAGLLDDLGRTIGRLARRFDDELERIVRRIVFRKRREAPTNHAGAVSRGAAFAIDVVFINLGFTAIAALVTLVGNAFGGSADGGSNFAIAAGSLTWLVLSGAYFVGFWTLAGQTPGMRFLGVRLAGGRLPLGRAIRRLIGIGISIFFLGLPFLGILFRDRGRDSPTASPGPRSSTTSGARLRHRGRWRRSTPPPLPWSPLRPSRRSPPSPSRPAPRSGSGASAGSAASRCRR